MSDMGKFVAQPGGCVKGEGKKKASLHNIITKGVERLKQDLWRAYSEALNRGYIQFTLYHNVADVATNILGGILR